MSTDEMIFKQALNDDVADKPFLEKSLVYIQDINPTSYSNNEIIFETNSLASNGRYNDFRNGYIQIPLVIAVTGKSGATASTTVDWTNANISKSDFMVALKGAYVNLIQSMSIDVGNVNAVQNTAYINSLLSFKLMSEMSLQDEKLHGPIIGFGKDGNGWRYASGPTATGRGLCNNVNTSRPINSGAGTAYCDFVNEGMYNRQQNFLNMDPDYDANQSRSVIFGADVSTANSYLKSSAINFVENKSTYKAWYLMATLRLKDLLFFQEMPALTKGVFVRIRLTVNQCSFNVTKTSAGFLDFRQSTMSIGPNGINPLMVGASVTEVLTHNVPTAHTDVTPDSVFVSGGSGCLPVGGAVDYDAVYSIALNVVRNTSLSLNHTINTCRLYCHSYLLNPAYEASYIEKPLRKFDYNDVVQYTASNIAPGSSFNVQITQGLRRIQQLVIIPIMNASSHASESYQYQNGTSASSPFSPLMSPFTGDGANCVSPYIMQNFQVQLGGRNIFLNPMTYTYEMFLSETMNTGLNSGLTTGLCSSRISHQDYVNNYGYIVVDMSRRYNQDLNASLSVQISGVLQGTKNYDLLCFLLFQKSCSLDITNGQFAILGENA